MDENEDFLPEIDQSVNLFQNEDDVPNPLRTNYTTGFDSTITNDPGILPGTDNNNEDPTLLDRRQVIKVAEHAPRTNAGNQRQTKQRKIGKKSRSKDDFGDITGGVDKTVERLKQRKKKKLSDEDSNNRVESLLNQMRRAYEQDMEKLTNGQPATSKLTLLDTVISEVSKPVMTVKFIRGGFLSILEGWLAPLPDKSLPNLTLRTKLLTLLVRLHVGTGVGERLIELWKSPEETSDNRQNIRKIVTSVTRPILGLRFGGSHLSMAQAQHDSYSQGLEEETVLANPHSAYRVSLPRVKARNFVVAPRGQWMGGRSMGGGDMGRGGGEDDDRLQRLMDLKVQRPRKKPMRSSHVSVDFKERLLENSDGMDSNNKFAFDAALLSLADTQRGIDGLLDYFFGFLGRKTDFYQKPQLARELCDKYITKYINNAEDAAKKEMHSTIASVNAAKTMIPLHGADAAGPTTSDFETPLNKINSNAVPASVIGSEPSTGESGGKKSINKGNGYDTDTYSWTQTLGTAEISIPLKSQTKRNSCKVKIDKRLLRVTVNNEVVLDERLEDDIRTDDSFWTLVDEKVLQVTLEKVKGMKWWSKVFQNHVELDTSKIVPETSKLSDLDGETRQTVEKMLFDQKQKQLGLPTSEQREQLDLIDKFKQAHPDLDFSRAKMSL